MLYYFQNKQAYQNFTLLYIVVITIDYEYLILLLNIYYRCFNYLT